MKRPSPEEAERDTRDWREAFLATVEPLPDVPVLLSGGMDSCALVAALVSIGRKPDCITYRMASTFSEDMAVATRLTRDLGLTLHRVLIPDDVASLHRDVEWAIPIVGTRKTRVECAIPMRYMGERASAIGATQVLTGDPGIIEDVRAYQVLTNASDGVETDESRAIRMARPATGINSASDAMRHVASLANVELLEPYRLDPLRSVALAMDPYRINWPRQKGIALRAFPDVFGDGRLPTPSGYRYWKHNKSLQTASGLSDSIARSYGVTSRHMLGIYNRIAAGG